MIMTFVLHACAYMHTRTHEHVPMYKKQTHTQKRKYGTKKKSLVVCVEERGVRWLLGQGPLYDCG